MKNLIVTLLLFSIHAMGATESRSAEDLAVLKDINSWNSINNPEYVQKKILKQDQESSVIALKVLNRINKKERSVTEYKAVIRGEDLYKTSSVQKLEE